ncbi:exodeoxyribonuclease VII large subunit [uncultured Campylobacter sp.]|uniref:exodeoxyribonuclease VII large subunit n=1 Tax=uncultured Campylobacter sp. TaxID=218934 RepID=UPI00261BB0AA|nr:exodeoxyribonuclease VII large subunit [uncultured Campylobacter sp.]
MLSVSELNAQAKALLETSFSFVEVEGEISKLRIQSTSGHWYFTIKDASAAIDCAMFKFNAARINFIPAVGDKLIVSGKSLAIRPHGRVSDPGLKYPQKRRGRAGSGVCRAKR